MACTVLEQKLNCVLNDMRGRFHYKKRTVHINNQEWHYVLGGSGIKFFPPDAKAIYVMYNKIYPGLDVERAIWKENFHVVPSDVKEFIVDNLL